MRAKRAAKSQEKKQKKWREIKRTNKKEHCLSASRVFDSTHIISGDKKIVDVHGNIRPMK